MLAALLAAACLVNIPLGVLRSRQRRFSPGWFVYVHVSIPLLYFLRHLEGFGILVVPPVILAAVLGQVAGGRIGGSSRGKTGHTED